MSAKRKTRESFKELDRQAHDTSDIKPLSERLRQEWEAARQTGVKAGRGRPRKPPGLRSRIVPVSIEPELLAEVDRFTKTQGVSRSRLVAEGLRLRMKAGVKKS